MLNWSTIPKASSHVLALEWESSTSMNVELAFHEDKENASSPDIWKPFTESGHKQELIEVESHENSDDGDFDPEEPRREKRKVRGRFQGRPPGSPTGEEICRR